MIFDVVKFLFDIGKFGVERVDEIENGKKLDQIISELKNSQKTIASSSEKFSDEIVRVQKELNYQATKNIKTFADSNLIEIGALSAAKARENSDKARALFEKCVNIYDDYESMHKTLIAKMKSIEELNLSDGLSSDLHELNGTHIDLYNVGDISWAHDVSFSPDKGDILIFRTGEYSYIFTDFKNGNSSTEKYILHKDCNPTKIASFLKSENFTALCHNKYGDDKKYNEDVDFGITRTVETVDYLGVQLNRTSFYSSLPDYGNAVLSGRVDINREIDWEYSTWGEAKLVRKDIIDGFHNGFFLESHWDGFCSQAINFNKKITLYEGRFKSGVRDGCGRYKENEVRKYVQFIDGKEVNSISLNE